MRQDARVRVKDDSGKIQGTPSLSEESAFSGSTNLSPEPKGKLKTIVKN